MRRRSALALGLPLLALASFLGWSCQETPDNVIHPDKILTVSRGPKLRAYLYKGFLSDEECDHLIEKSRSRLHRSGVVDTNTGKSVQSEIRTSKGTFFNRQGDEIISGIEYRIANWTHLPMENGEGLQILNYQIGEKYSEHYDYFFHEAGNADGGNRIATVLMYLSTPKKGGETVFPNVKPPKDREGEWSDCAKKGVAVKPYKGDAILFWSMKVNGELDHGSMHSSCPVIEGEKWSATKWIHVGEYGKGKRIVHKVYAEEKVTQKGDCSNPRSPTCCKDLHEKCDLWANTGECDKNPTYMVGTPENPGNCRFSCEAC